MPSSAYVQGAIGRQLISTSFQTPHSFQPNDVLIGPMSRQAMGDDIVGVGGTNFVSTAYALTNAAVGYQFAMAEPFLVYKVWWMNGTTATTNNADVGVYNEAGTVLHVSGGSTAITGANVVQEKDCTDTLLPAGRYWCVYSQNGTTATPMTNTPATNLARAMGLMFMAGAVPLGSTFSSLSAATTIIMCGIAARTQVA